MLEFPGSIGRVGVGTSSTIFRSLVTPIKALMIAM
jgi:hypothetical protein